MSPRAAHAIFVAVGAAHVGLGLVMVFAPGHFYEGLATFQLGSHARACSEKSRW
jgi:hypothetical protein